jgi:hypothetical protein
MADGGLYVDRISMNEKHGKRGKWIGLFYLTLSDILKVEEYQKQGHF